MLSPYKGGTVTAKVDLKMVFINYTYLLFKCIIYYDMKVSMVGKEPLGCWVCALLQLHCLPCRICCNCISSLCNDYFKTHEFFWESHFIFLCPPPPVFLVSAQHRFTAASVWGSIIPELRVADVMSRSAIARSRECADYWPTYQSQTTGSYFVFNMWHNTLPWPRLMVTDGFCMYNV